MKAVMNRLGRALQEECLRLSSFDWDMDRRGVRSVEVAEGRSESRERDV